MGVAPTFHNAGTTDGNELITCRAYVSLGRVADNLALLAAGRKHRIRAPRPGGNRSPNDAIGKNETALRIAGRFVVWESSANHGRVGIVHPAEVVNGEVPIVTLTGVPVLDLVVVTQV